MSEQLSTRVGDGAGGASSPHPTFIDFEPHGAHEKDTRSAGVVVHEWVERSGGAENVVEQMLAAFPGADLRVLWDDAPGRFPIASTDTWLARTPLRRHKALALPLMLPTWRTLRSETHYDWILTSSHLFAHHARFTGVDAEIPKFSYVHTPARYIWAPEYDPRGAGTAARAAAPALRRVDRARAQESVAIAANSAFIADRIAAAWEREAVVIHPPVNVDRITAQRDWRSELTDDELEVLENLPDEFALGVSRFVFYKRLDLVIAAGEQANIPVVLAGRGPEESVLRAAARSARISVDVVSSPSNALLYALYQRASVLVFPAIEDFGIVPVEAQAAGTPVVTGPFGGQTETFAPGVSGVIADSLDAVDLARGITAARELLPFDPVSVTRRFGNDVFVQRIREFVNLEK
ncbi:glycosyltransferase [Humibacter sp. RRB41]|uniref:glycosyltransferase n=1 Tax=Humibacter sp. RRB41 TaxID=2919946 RepID=UPI001FAA5D5E|nr:glycosyltransferase [Humibacter sp. RRB41]